MVLPVEKVCHDFSDTNSQDLRHFPVLKQVFSNLPSIGYTAEGNRLAVGLYGDSEPVDEGVSELRIFFGPGYRIYFGEDTENIAVLLCGCDKNSQDKDIKAPKEYWKEYKDNG